MNRRIMAAVLVFVMLAGLLGGCISATGMYIAKDGTYYRNKDGTNHVGFLETEEGILYFQEDGRKLEEGLITVDGQRYYIHNGLMVTGWQDLGQGTFYFDEMGRAVRGKQVIDGKTYLFDEDTGVLIEEVQPGDVVSPLPTDQPAEPSAEPSPTPSAEPSNAPTPTPTQSQAPSNSAAVGALTGNDRLDQEVKKLIDKLCDPDKDAAYNLGELFDWMVEDIKYKYVTVDLSNGYTEELVYDLAEYLVLNRRGSCEHQAALMAVFAMRLGYESKVVAGEFLSDDGTEWVEHAWALSYVNGSWYHFDPLFGRNHTGGRPRTFFMKRDADIEAVHRWDRDAYPAAE